MGVHPRTTDDFRAESESREFISSIVIAEVEGAVPVYDNLVHLSTTEHVNGSCAFY
jgi:hypothetical protein